MNHNIIDILKTRLQENGVVLTDHPVVGGSYILSDGTFIDIHASYIKGTFKNSRFASGVHCDIDYIMSNKLRDMIDDIMACRRNILGRAFNAIKLQDGVCLSFESPYIVFPKEPITEQQYSQVLQWIYQTCSKQPRRDFGIGFYDDTRRYYRCITIDYDQNGMTPEDLIKEIKKFYNIASIKSIEEAINSFKVI